MQNHWMRKHLNRSHREQSITNNYAPIVLTWEGVDNFIIMPIIRNNYIDSQSGWAIYTTELELERKESYGRRYSQIR